MKIIIFEFLVLIKYFLFIISILGILVLAHRKNLVQANVHPPRGCSGGFLINSLCRLFKKFLRLSSVGDLAKVGTKTGQPTDLDNNTQEDELTRTDTDK